MGSNRNPIPAPLAQGLDFISQIPAKLQNSIKVNFRNFLRNDRDARPSKSLTVSEELSHTHYEANLDKQLQAWRNNPTWSNKPPQIKVTVPKGSLCNLDVQFEAGLPPDAIYNIVIDPDNKRVFKNIKEVISRKVLIDEGSRQVVEVEQAALWRFLWWSGTISVHVIVDQDRKNHTVKFKQGKTGFMRRFEGSWKMEPIFIDIPTSLPPNVPKTLSEYEKCTDNKGRVGSKITLNQLIEPALVPPPPVSWYLRGITAKTTEMLVHDLLAEIARLRGARDDGVTGTGTGTGKLFDGQREEGSDCRCGDCRCRDDDISGNDIKERWRWRRRNKHCRRRDL